MDTLEAAFDRLYADGAPMHSVVVEVPKALVLNANKDKSLHHAPRGQRARAIRQLAAAAAHQKPAPAMLRAHCLARVGFPDRTRRDVHNWWPTIKPAVDGIVTDAGWLPDDDNDHLIGPDLRPYVAGKRGFVVLEFNFLVLEVAA